MSAQCLVQAAVERAGGIIPLALACHLSRQTVYQWLSGRRRPSLRSLQTLAAYMGDDWRSYVVAGVDGGQ